MALLRVLVVNRGCALLRSGLWFDRVKRSPIVGSVTTWLGPPLHTHTHNTHIHTYTHTHTLSLSLYTFWGGPRAEMCCTRSTSNSSGAHMHSSSTSPSRGCMHLAWAPLLAACVVVDTTSHASTPISSNASKTRALRAHPESTPLRVRGHGRPDAP